MMNRQMRMEHRRRLQETIESGEVKNLKGEDLKYILPFIKKYRFSLILSIFWTVFNSILGIFPPLISIKIIDVGIPNESSSDIIFYASVLAVIYLVFFFSSYLQNRISTKMAQKVLRDIRVTEFQKLLQLSMEYYNENRRGELLSVVINDVNILSTAITNGIIGLFSDVFTLFGILIAMLQLDWQLGLTTYLIIPIIVFSVRKYRKRIKHTHIKIRQKVAELNANVEENVSGIRVAQSLAVEERNVKNFNKLTTENYELRMKSVNTFAVMSAVVSINTFLGLSILIAIGGQRYITGGITLGILVAFLQYSTQFIRPLWGIANLSNTFLEAGAALIHIQDYSKIEPDIVESPNPIPFKSEPKGEIVLKDVSFTYTNKFFIENLNLKINPKEKIGIVGETGAGKSTLIKLITRLYDVKSGSIEIDGINIKDLAFKDLRKLMAIVSQDVFLFNGSIMLNIRFGRPTANDEEVIQAAKLAQCHEFIQKMPDKYNTKLGDQGTGLSGGQKQLIAYARMILAKPKIAILDEATSNIDSYTENIIQENMSQRFEGCTVLIIAHRFATLKSVDRLILIKDGRIEDTGTHDELLQKNPYYKELCEKQFSKL